MYLMCIKESNTGVLWVLLGKCVALMWEMIAVLMACDWECLSMLGWPLN